jgi:hypothetical protein
MMAEVAHRCPHPPPAAGTLYSQDTPAEYLVEHKLDSVHIIFNTRDHVSLTWTTIDRGVLVQVACLSGPPEKQSIM